MARYYGQYDSIRAKGNLRVEEDTVLSGDFAVTGDVTITGAWTVTGALTVSDTTASTSTTTGSGIFGGGLGVAGTAWIGDTLTVTVTDPTAPANSLYAVMDVGVGYTSGSANAVKGYITSDMATGNSQNMSAGWFGLNWEATYAPTQVGVARALNVEVVTKGSRYPHAIVYIQSVPSAVPSSHADMPYITFTESGSGTGSNILFELGGKDAAQTVTIGTGNLFYENTIQIAVNEVAGTRTAWYIPLSDAEASFSTAFPIATTSTITLTPAATGTYLDFDLAATYTLGTLINVDFSASTTLTNTLVGFNLDLGGSVVATSEKSVTGLDVNLPAMTMTEASPALVGLKVTAQGAFTLETSGTPTWAGVDIALPAITQSAGTVTTYGMHITQGAVTSGLQYGIYMEGGTAYLPLQVGVKSSSSGVGLKIAGSGDNSGGIQIYADDAGVAAVGEVITPFRSRYLLTVDQSGGVSQTAFFAQLVSGGSGTRTYNTGAFRAAYIFNQQGTTTLVTSAECLGINQATTLGGTMTVGSGCTFAGIDVNIAGGGAINNSGTAAAILVRSKETPVWPVGLQIATAGAAIGISMATTTQGIVSVVSTLPSNARGDSFKYSVATPAMGDGFGAHEVELSIVGVGTGNAAASSAWVNIPDAGTAASGGYICARTDGIWEHLDADVTGAYLVFGAKMTADISDTDFSRLVPFCLNSVQDISALFMIGSPDSKAGITIAAGGCDAAVGSAKGFIDSNGTVYYIKLYSNPAA